MALDPKDPSEAYAIEFDFSSELTAVTSAEVTVEVLAGSDTNAGSVLNGAAQTSGARVRQRVQGGVHGREYGLRCVASDGVETYVLTARLLVATKRG